MRCQGSQQMVTHGAAQGGQECLCLSSVSAVALKANRHKEENLDLGPNVFLT